RRRQAALGAHRGTVFDIRGRARGRRKATFTSRGLSAMEIRSGRRHEKYERLVQAAQELTPATTAVAHPCDRTSIEGVVEAARLGLLKPLLVGPSVKIRAAAEQAALDISG